MRVAGKGIFLAKGGARGVERKKHQGGHERKRAEILGEL